MEMSPSVDAGGRTHRHSHRYHADRAPTVCVDIDVAGAVSDDSDRDRGSSAGSLRTRRTAPKGSGVRSGAGSPPPRRGTGCGTFRDYGPAYDRGTVSCRNYHRASSVVNHNGGEEHVWARFCTEARPSQWEGTVFAGDMGARSDRCGGIRPDFAMLSSQHGSLV